MTEQYDAEGSEDSIGSNRAIFLKTASQIADLLSDEEVGRRWDEPSALELMTVGTLAGHTARAIFQVEAYIDVPVPDGDPMDAPSYFLRLGDPTDLTSDINTAIRQRSEAASSGGHQDLVASVRGCLERLAARLPDEPPDRKVEAFGSLILLDDYLDTRLVEMTVHHDDLTHTLGISTPDLPVEAQDRAIAVLLEMAKRGHGRSAILRALTRRERDDVQALRVF